MKVYGHRYVYSDDYSEVLCLNHEPDPIVPPEAIRPITLGDLREEAFWCEVCDSLILPSEEAWEEATEEEREQFTT